MDSGEGGNYNLPSIEREYSGALLKDTVGQKTGMPINLDRGGEKSGVKLYLQL